MKKLLSFMRGEDWVFLLVFAVAMYFQVTLSLMIPESLKTITGALNANGVDMGALVGPCLRMLLCAVGSVGCAVVGGLCIARASASVIMRLREATVTKIISFSMAEMSDFISSSLITRCTNDIMQIQTFSALGVQVLVQCPIMAMVALSKMHGNLAWLIATASTIALVIVVHVIVILLVQKKTMLVQRLIDKLNRVTREHLSGLRVIHAYNAYQFQNQQFDEANDELSKTSLFVDRSVGMLSPFLTVAVNGLSLVIYILGAVMINGMDSAQQKMALYNEMIVMSSYALQVMAAFVFMLLAAISLPRFMVALKRVNEVLDSPKTIVDGRFETGVGGLMGSIEFRDVSFAYPGAAGNAISHISFKVEQGMTLAIIGPTGSGKSTLMNLIPRLYDVTDGQILVDGRDVRDYKLWALRDKVGYVPQKSFLFSGTIASNIDYGTKSGFQASITDIKKAAELGQSKEFIESKEGAYGARVEEGGSNFSGGQRQRLTISRAICRDPEIYLFDDSFSALDFKTDAVLRRQLRKNARGATQVIVGQRIGSVKSADLILVMDNGRLVGKGRHEELMQTCEVYREIALSQLSSEEVK